MATTKDFIRKFHAIDGTTIGERRKNLFKLLELFEKAELDLSMLKPQNHLEETFKIDALIYLRDVNALIDVFKTENAALIKKVVKVDWLWSAFDANIVEKIFPQISFNSKLKIINKLGVHLKNTQQADAIYTVIKEKYGMYLAVKLLPCCSLTLISENFTRNVVKHLSTRQILFIIRKHPDVARLLLQNQSKNWENHKCIFRELLQNHLELFEQAYTSTAYSYYLKLGWRATNKFVVTNKTRVIERAAYFYEYLHKKQLVKTIRVDFLQFYLKICSEPYSKFKPDLNVYLDLLDTGKVPNKLELFATTFKTVFGVEFFETDVINLRILELMNEQQRSCIAQHLDMPNTAWLCLKKPDESLPLLQKRIALTSDTNGRAQLVGNLIETCRIHNDSKALLEVFKYVYKSHRNDDTAVLTCFVNSLDSGSWLSKLTDEHWFYLAKIVNVLVRRDTIWINYSNCLFAYTYFLFTQKKSLKPIVRVYAQKGLDFANFARSGVHRKIATDFDFEKQYLIVLAEVLPEIYKDKELRTQYVTYLRYLIRWNKKHPNDLLSLFDNKEAIAALLNEWQNENTYNYLCASVLTDILCSKQVPDKPFWASTFFKKKSYSDMTLMEWLIRNEPLIVRDNIELIFNCILDIYYTQVYRFFFTMSRNYAHLELPQTITRLCVKVITSTDKDESQKKNALTALSFVVADPQELITLLTPYYPVDKTEPDAVVYVMQQNMSRSLGNVTPPSSMLQSVLLFSKGDYTKFIRRSMYFIAFSVTEDKLPQFFTALNNSAVSVRKHAIYLSFRVLDRNAIYNIVKRNFPDKNVSIRKFLLRSIFNFFIKNPDEFLWNMLKESIKNVDIEDKEALDVLMQLKKIPEDYMIKYLEFITAFIVLDDKIADLIDDSIYANLESDFITKIIDSSKCGDVFIYKCLVNSNNSALQLSILGKVFNQRKDLNKASEFLKQSVEYFCNKNCSNLTLFHKCTELLDGLQPHDKYFTDCLYLQLCAIYMEFHLNHKSVPTFVEALVLAGDAFMNKYKSIMFNKFCDVVSMLVRRFFVDDNLFTLVQNVIENSRSEYCIIMGLSLLPNPLHSPPKLKLAYTEILQKLQNIEHPMTNIALALYLNQHMPRHNIIEEQLKCESSSDQHAMYLNPYYVNSAYASTDIKFV